MGSHSVKGLGLTKTKEGQKSFLQHGKTINSMVIHVSQAFCLLFSLDWTYETSNYTGYVLKISEYCHGDCVNRKTTT